MRSDMRVGFVGMAFLLASCGDQDPQDSRITGRWRTDSMGPTSNFVDLALSQDEKSISGIADVNSVVYDLEGRWEGSLRPDEAIRLDMTVTVRGFSIKGTGTLSTGAEDADLTVDGRRTGMAFQMSVHPETDEPLKVSGQIGYGMSDFKLAVEIANIPPSLPGGERRDLKLTVRGKARGGPIDLF